MPSQIRGALRTNRAAGFEVKMSPQCSSRNFSTMTATTTTTLSTSQERVMHKPHASSDPGAMDHSLAMHYMSPPSSIETSSASEVFLQAYRGNPTPVKHRDVESRNSVDTIDHNAFSTSSRSMAKKISEGLPKIRKRRREIPDKKGPWTHAEDAMLSRLVHLNGPRKWKDIAHYIPGRTGKQARERWINQLSPLLKKDARWTESEDRFVVLFQARYGNRWSKIASHLPGRTDNHIKNRFNSTLKRKRDEGFFDDWLNQNGLARLEQDLSPNEYAGIVPSQTCVPAPAHNSRHLAGGHAIGQQIPHSNSFGTFHAGDGLLNGSHSQNGVVASGIDSTCYSHYQSCNDSPRIQNISQPLRRSSVYNGSVIREPQEVVESRRVRISVRNLCS